MVRYVCIGGMILDGSRSGSYVSGVRLLQLYSVSNLYRQVYCVVADGDNDPRLHGLKLEELTVLRPREDGKYGFPSVTLPLTDNVIGLMNTMMKKSDSQDFGVMPILDDALEDADYNDPLFPWLLRDLRHPEWCKKIDPRIWYKSMVRIKMMPLLRAASQNAAVHGLQCGDLSKAEELT